MRSRSIHEERILYSWQNEELPMLSEQLDDCPEKDAQRAKLNEEYHRVRTSWQVQITWQVQ